MDQLLRLLMALDAKLLTVAADIAVVTAFNALSCNFLHNPKRHGIVGVFSIAVPTFRIPGFLFMGKPTTTIDAAGGLAPVAIKHNSAAPQAVDDPIRSRQSPSEPTRKHGAARHSICKS